MCHQCLDARGECAPVAGVVLEGGRPGLQAAHDGDVYGTQVARQQDGSCRDYGRQPLQGAVLRERQLCDVGGQVLVLHPACRAKHAEQVRLAAEKVSRGTYITL